MSNNQPDTLDQIISTMASTPYPELINMTYKHESVNRVFNEHKSQIFKEKTKVNYPCISTAEEIFMIVDRSRDIYDNVCRRKEIRALPKWEDAKVYFRRSMIAIFTSVVEERELFVTNMERIPFVMDVLTNFYELDKMRRITDIELWNDVVYVLFLFHVVYTATRNPFTRSYLETKVNAFFANEGVGGQLFKLARYRSGIENLEDIRSKAVEILNIEGRLRDRNINILGQDILSAAIFVTFRAIIDRESEMEAAGVMAEFEE
jgi:hypothetical protein